MEHVKKALQLKVCAVFFLLSPCGLSILCYLQTSGTPKTANTNTPTKVQFTGRDLIIIFKNIAGRANIADRAT